MNRLSILLLDTEPRTSNAYITLAIRDALVQHPAVDRVVLASHGDALRRFVDDGLDTFIAFGSARTQADILARLARLARLSILWTTEDPYELAHNVACSKPFDIVFTNDLGSLAAYGGRAHHLPLAASQLFQDFDVRTADPAYRYDLLFIGTAWPNRVRSLNRILSSAPKAWSVKVALPWNEFIGPPRLLDETILSDWRCGNRDFARFANQSRIVLTLPRHFSASASTQAVGSTPPPRLFETALAGGCQVVVSAEAEVGHYYAPGSEIVLCENDDEAIGAISALLAEPERRIDMAEAARARTLREHLYTHRVARMLKLSLGLEHAPAAAEPRRQTVLYVTHNRLGFGPGGGVEVYQDILTGLAPDYEVLFLFPVQTDGAYSLCLQGSGETRRYDHGPIDRTILTDDRVEQIFSQVLVERAVDIVHFHHLINLPLSLPLIAKAYGLPVVWHLHDYFIICDRYNLIDFERKFCDVVHKGTGQCDACLIAADNRGPGAKARRDGFMTSVIRSIDMFVGSTPYSTDYLRGAYPEVGPDRVRVIELPVLTGSAVPVQESPPTGAGPLNVALPGNFTREKGADHVVELMRLCEGLDIRFHVFGRLEPYMMARLAGLEAGRVTVLNGYDQSEIVALMSICDVSLHMSIWPETYMLSLSEAWQAALVPIVTTLGAPGERVTPGVDGFTIPPRDPTSALACLQRLYFDRDLLYRMRQGIRRKVLADIPTHLGAIRDLYADLTARRPRPSDTAGRLPPHDPGISCFDAGFRVNSPSWASPDNLWDPRPDRLPSEDDANRVPLIEALPLRQRLLLVDRVSMNRDGVHAAVDEFRLDGRPSHLRSKQNVVLRQVFLRGWMLNERRPDPQQVYLRLRSERRHCFAALLRDERGDLDAQFDVPGTANAGFRGFFDVSSLESGSYQLDILQVAGGRMSLLETVFEIDVQSTKDFGQPHLGFWREDPERQSRQAAPLSRIGRVVGVQHNLPVLADVLIGRRDAVWQVMGGIEREGMADRIAEGLLSAVLEGSAGRRSFSTPAYWKRPAPAADESAHRRTGDFAYATALSSLDPGEYRLMMTLDTGGRTGSAVPTPIRLFVPPVDADFLWTDEPPLGIEPGRVVSHIETLSFDHATIVPGSHDQLIRCAGWSFVDHRGEPQGSLLEWSDGPHKHYVVCGITMRDDVVQHLDQPDARSSGFDFAMPERALQAEIRFIQRYADGMVEFTTFKTALRKALEPTSPPM